MNNNVSFRNAVERLNNKQFSQLQHFLAF